MAISTIGQNGLAVPLVTSADASISGLTVGKGGGSVANNTVVGNGAGSANTTGTIDAFGSAALGANTSGTRNAAFGIFALYSNTTGVSNISMGRASLATNTTGSYNTAMGDAALNGNTTASYNTAVGYQAGYSTTTGGHNVFIGPLAGYNITTGTNNTFIGTDNGADYTCGGRITTGSKNTIIGGYSGNQGITGANAVDIRTSSNNIVLSDGDGNPRLWFNSAGTMQSYTNVNGDVTMYMVNYGNSSPYGLQVTFQNAAPNNSSQFFFLGNDSSANRFVAMSNGGLKNYQANNVNLSDEREKKNISLAGNYLDKLCQVSVKTFLFNDQTDTDLNLGVIAQELKTICPELVTEENWATKDEPEKLRLSIYETDLKYAMLKAIQELKAEVDSLKQQLGK